MTGPELVTGPEAAAHTVAHTVARTVAVVLAGGSGVRFGGPVPKQLLEVAGKPIIEHALAAFDAAPEVDEVLAVMAPGFAHEVEKIVDAGPYPKVSRVIDGGATRNESTRRAIAALAGGEYGGGERGVPVNVPVNVRVDVLLHDAARPLVDQRIISECVRALRTREAVCTAIPTTDTVLVVEEGMVTRIPDRSGLWRCQTPQGFRLSVIRRAYDLAMADPAFAEGREPTTDDCGVLLRYLPGVPIHVVEGSDRNVKITHPDDLRVAEAYLRGHAAGRTDRADRPAPGVRP